MAPKQKKERRCIRGIKCKSTLEEEAVEEYPSWRGSWDHVVVVLSSGDICDEEDDASALKSDIRPTANKRIEPAQQHRLEGNTLLTTRRPSSVSSHYLVLCEFHKRFILF